MKKTLKKKDIFIKLVVETARILLGLTFMFSGFAKSVDPLGTAYKIGDYFSAFHLSSLSFLALPLSIFLCALEFLLGVFLLLGIYRRWTSRLVLLVMCFMTPLTLYLALANPVADCGCFGEAYIITNWQTFYKNIVLLMAALFVVINRERIGNFFTVKTYWLAFLYILIFTAAFIGRNYYYDPLFDFRPYTIGTDIPKLMPIPERKRPKEQTLFTYEKNGVKKEFTEANYPWEDSTWTFVSMNTQAIQIDEMPKIKDFSINVLNLNREKDSVLSSIDRTQDILADTGYVFLMIVPSLTEMNGAYLSSFEDVAFYAEEYKYGFFCLTASGTDDILAWEKEQVSNFTFATSDDRALKTIIRSNPGLLLLKNGVIVNKWIDSRVPAEENLTAPLEKLPYSQLVNQRDEDKKNLLYISLLFLLPLLTLKMLDLLFYRQKANKTEEE